MSDKLNLIKQINEDLDIADGIFNNLLEIYYEDAEKQIPTISCENIENLMWNLSSLQNKHIPAELCSNGKLLERSGEIETYIQNINLFIKEVKILKQ
ncbi:hypothetical protein OAI86_03115 [Alphaproteobacteria bacterium]|jgi:hypothetical protein|nr:hypothetical protein [Alphaproteobacteria bacterium]